MRQLLAVAIAVAMAGACSEETIERGVCGNGIVEPGEDCDSIDRRCNACGIECVTTADCEAYGNTAGFVCGPDFFCHAPGGVFEPAGAIATPVTTLRVTDSNRDSFGDVLMQSQTQVMVLFGDATGSLATSSKIQMPSPQGVASYADLDGDGAVDVLAPTQDGIVAFTTPFGVPSPYPFPSLVGGDMGTPLFVHPVRNADPRENHLAVIGIEPVPPHNLALLILDVASNIPDNLIPNQPLCGAQLGDLDPDDVEVFSLAQPGHELLAVTLRPPAPATSRLCLVQIDRNGATYDVAVIDSVGGAEPVTRPVFANLRGLPCPSLVLGQNVGSGVGTVEHPPVDGTAVCRYGAANAAMPNSPAGAVPVGAVPLAPAISGVGPVALALDKGIFAFAGGGIAAGPPLYISDRTLSAVQIASLTGDGDLDVVAIGSNVNDIDLLERDQNQGVTAFVRQRLETLAPVSRVLIGDFDGRNDAIADILYVERGADEDRLVISYGTTDGPLPGVVVGTFGRVTSVIGTAIPDSGDQLNKITDVAVLFDSGLGEQLALLHGSTSRTMLAFFDPRQPPPEQGSTFRGVVVGDFGGDDNANDVLAIEDSPTNIYVAFGATGGALQNPLDALPAPFIVTCKPGQPPSSETFCSQGAHYVAWPNPAGPDRVVGIDSKLDIAVFDVVGAAVMMTQSSGALIAPAGTAVRSAQVIQLDGSPRLLVSLGPASPDVPDPRHAVAVNLCSITNDVPSCIDLAAVVTAGLTPDDPAMVCVDAGLALVARASRFEPPDKAGADLVVVCRPVEGVSRDTVFRVSLDGTIVQRMLELGSADTVQLGDVTGDGIADLVTVDRSDALPVVRVFRQCNSRDVDCGEATFVGGEEERN